MKKTMVAFMAILIKDVRNYYLKPPNISWGLIFPLSWALMQFSLSPSPPSVAEVLPGVMALSVLFGTTSMLAVALTFERRSRSFERLLTAPIGLTTMVWAKLSGAIIFGMVNAAWPVLLAASLGVDLSAVDWPLAFLGVLFIAVASSLLGLMVAVTAKEVFEAQTLSNLYRFPMIFLCGLFIPVQSLPWILQPLSYVLPITYGVDILRQGLLMDGMFETWASVTIGIGFIVILYALSMRGIKRRWLL